MNAAELSMSVTALANLIASGLRDEKLALASAVFTQLGDNLATISAHRDLAAACKDADPDAKIADGADGIYH